MDKLSPDAREIYDMLQAETEEAYEERFLAHKKKILDAVKTSSAKTRIKDHSASSIAIPTTTPASASASTSTHASRPATTDDLSPGARSIYDYLVGTTATPTSAAPVCVPSSAVPIGGISERAAATPSPTSAPASKDDLSPKARRIYDYLIGNSAAPPTSDVSTNLWARTELDAVHDAVEDPAAPTPTTYSTICLEADTSVTLTPSSTVASSAPTTASAVTVPAASMGPAAGGLLEDGDNLSSTPPLVCLIMSPSGGICTVASEPCSVSPNFVIGVSDFSLTPAAYLVDDVDIIAASPTKLAISTLLHLSSQSPTSTTAALLSADGFTMHMLMRALSLATEIKRPWPPPCYVRCQEGNMCKDMLQALLLDGFVLQSMQLMLWAGKYRWPPPTPNRSKACRISNLQCTMEPECNMTLTVSTFTIGVQRAQLQQTMFKWSDRVCHDTYSLIASTRVDRRLDLLLARRATCTLWTWYYLHNRHCSPGSNNFAISDWALLILSLETWLLLNCDFASVKIQRSITVQKSTRSSGFFASLEGVELKLWPALLVSIFVPSVQNAQLQPTVFRWPVDFSNMTLAVASIVAGLQDTSLMTEVATQNGSCDYLEPVLRFIINLFSWSPHSKWPPMSSGPFLISADVDEKFMGMLSLTVVLSRLFILVAMKTEAMLRPFCHFATGNTIPLLPWDPGLSLSGVDILFSTLVDSLAVRLSSSSVVTCLQGKSIHVLFSLSFVVELIKTGMVVLEELQPWPSWERPLLVQSFSTMVQVVTLCPNEVSLGNFAIVDNTMMNRYSHVYAWMLLNDSFLPAGIYSYKGNPCPCGFELLPWKFARTLVLEFSTVRSRSSGNYSADLTFSCTSYACAREFHQGFSSDQTSRIFLTKVTTAVHIITCKLLLFVKTHDFRVVFLQPKPPWSYPAPTISIDVAESLHIIGVSLEFSQFGPSANHGSRLSQDWIIYLPDAYIMQCGFEIMPWGIAYSRNGILAYTKQVLISWDPGGSVSALAAATGVNWNSTPLPLLHLTWDPGDSTQHRLEGKPDFKKGGLSTTYLYKRAGGPYVGLWPVGKPEAEDAWRHIYLQSGHNGTRLGTNRTDGLGLEGEDRLGRGVCHLLPPVLPKFL